MNKRTLAIASLMPFAFASTAVAQDQSQQPSPLTPMDQPGRQQYFLPEGFITATGRPEPISRLVGTVQVIHQDRIAKSTARSVTELLNENAVGFMSEWTPGQTSINIRGAATEGQGRDFKSQVLVLINGHRAGTANISKLSSADIERIEIVRGPSSVIYGSQNMGGVINIILKTGLTAPGNVVQADAGSWNLLEGKAASGGLYKGFDWYVGGAASTRDNYAISGGAPELNTAWTRYGATGAFGYQIDETSRIEGTVRSDGIYNAGFRGSSANLFAFDTRYNYSFDTSYLAKTRDGQGNVYFQAYFVTDVDDLNNPSPLSALNAPASRTTTDHNRRQLDILGTRFQPRYKLFSGNELLFGLDWERSWLRSDRYRLGGAAVTQLSPQDNNQTDNVFAFYLEDSQSFFDDKLIVRGGVRQTWGTTALDWTPYAPTLVTGTNPLPGHDLLGGRDLRLHRLAGRPRRRLERLSRADRHRDRRQLHDHADRHHDLRQSGTGAGDQPAMGGRRHGNVERRPLRHGGVPEHHLQPHRAAHRLLDRRPRRAGPDQQPGQPRGPGHRVPDAGRPVPVVQLAAGRRRPVLERLRQRLLQLEDDRLRRQPACRAPTSRSRINKYGASIGTLFGQMGTQYPWSLQLLGILRGPMWYNTEESLSPVFFPGQNRTVSVYEKGAFWVWNSRLEVEVIKDLKLFAAVNNIFDVNNHPIFIAQDATPAPPTA